MGDAGGIPGMAEDAEVTPRGREPVFLNPSQKCGKVNCKPFEEMSQL